MNKIKKYIVTTLMALSMVLPIIQPLAVHAEETAGQVISISSNYAYDVYEVSYQATLNLKEGSKEVVGYFGEFTTGANGQSYTNQCLSLGYYNGERLVSFSTRWEREWINTYTSHYVQKKDGKIVEESMNSDENLINFTSSKFITKIIDGYYTRANCTWSGFKMFETKEDAENYLKTGSTSGLVVVPDESNMKYSPEVPTPELVFNTDGGLKFGFNNASEDYCVEMKGRWWSVDDITLFKKNLTWKYSYESLIKNDLSTWVSASETASAEGEHDLSVYGAESFDDLLSTYPLDSRTYLGGSNAIGNFLFGYNDALSTLKMLLGECTSSYNSAEIYVRYYTKDANGNYVYGKWCHWLGALANQAGSTGSTIDDDNIYKGYQSETGLTDDDITNLETTGNSRNDIDLKEETNGEYVDPIIGVSNDDFIGYFKQALDILSSLPQLLGEIPSLFGQIVSFLPSWIIACIGVGIVLVIILRIAGR